MYNHADATLKNVGVGDGLEVDRTFQGTVAYLTSGF